jgi:hypothetical protein
VAGQNAVFWLVDILISSAAIEVSATERATEQAQERETYSSISLLFVSIEKVQRRAYSERRVIQMEIGTQQHGSVLTALKEMIASGR